VAGGVWFWYTQRRGKGLPSNTPDLAAVGTAANGAATADTTVDGATAGAGEQPAGTDREPAGAAGDGTAETAAGAGPGGEPHAEVGADVGADRSGEAPPAS
jgi:hypothetical protein